MKKIIIISLLSVIQISWCSAQSAFGYRRKLPPITKEGWYNIALPADAFQYTNSDFSDIRILQINGSDTTEQPYLLRTMNDDVSEGYITLPILNKSRKDGKLYFTFKLQKGQAVNYLDLDFEEDNFNGYVNLEGSHNQKEWFEITRHQRILSISNATIDFDVQTVQFPITDYQYLRAEISSDRPLTLNQVSFRSREITSGEFDQIPLTHVDTNDKKSKQSVSEIKLDTYRTLSKISVTINHEGDYYRSFTLEALRDSVQAPNKSWIYNFEHLSSGYLTSIRPNEFEFPMTLTRKLKLTIHNEDNAPLSISQIKASGPIIKLITHLKPGQFELCYGNKSLTSPSYDLVHFTDQVPAQTETLAAGKEEKLFTDPEKISPLLENKNWLWGAMLIIMALLGFATLRMMSKK